MENKKAELTTQQLVTIIILILSFGVILFLFFRLSLGETSDKEICHNSVLLQSKSSLASGPIDCKINYVCISGGEKCSDKKSEIIREANTKDEIMQIIVEEMADCWWMFGEGGIDYGSRNLIGTNTICALCSIISFDETLKPQEKISYEEINNYLINHNKGSKTYFNYIYPWANDAKSIQEHFYIEDYLENNIEFNKEYVILTGISKLPRYLIGGFGFLGPQFDAIPITILEKTDENYRGVVECDGYVTKS